MLLAACSGGGGGQAAKYTIGGTISGLTGRVQLDNNGEAFQTTANGPYHFPTSVATGGPYDVTVVSQPNGQTCTVTNFSGTVGGANITNVNISCVTTSTTTYTIGGTYSGLIGTVVLKNNNTDPLTIRGTGNGTGYVGTTAGSGTFTFAAGIVSGGNYDVTVATQPAGQTCTITSGGIGAVALANITSVVVTCTSNSGATFNNVGGTVSGLSGSGLVLRNNGGDPLTISANGSFAFAAKVLTGQPYSVSIGTQPSASFCTVDPPTASGTMGTSDITNVSVTCVPAYTVGGTVSGFQSGLQLVNNGGNNLAITANGAFAFSTALPSSASYSVTVSQQPTGYTCAVTGGDNDSGGGTVGSGNVTSITVNCTVNLYSIGGRVSGLTTGTSLVLLDNGTDSLTISGNGSFTFATQVAYNTTYTVLVKNQPAQLACSVTNGFGTVTGNVTNVTVTCAAPKPRYAYVISNNDGTVSTYAIDATSGQLRLVNGSVAAGTNPKSITVDPSGRFAYVANSGSNNISAYTINTATGVLTSVGSAVAAGTQPQSVTVDPSTRFAYVANKGTNDISAYTINISTGALTQINCGGGGGCSGGTRFAAGTQPQSVTVDPSGRFAYVANSGSGDVYAYTIDTTTGALSSIGSPTLAGTSPQSVTVDPAGRFAYVANGGSGNVSAYTIDTTTGALTSVVGSPFAAGTTPQFVTVDPSSKFAYVANSGSGDVSAYTIDTTTGALTSVGSPVSAGTTPKSVTVDPSGKFAYVVNAGSNSVSVYTIDGTTGALTPLASFATAVTRQNPSSLVITRGTAPVTYTPKFAYVANWNAASISAYNIDAATGVLTRIVCPNSNALCDGASNFHAGWSGSSKPQSVTVDPTGRFAYVANYGEADVTAYTINSSTGVLTLIDCGGGSSCSGAPPKQFVADTAPYSIVVDPTGQFAYVVNSDLGDSSCSSGCNVSMYSINAVTGALTSKGVAGAGINPFSIAIDPSGRFAYVVNYTSNDISAYAINATTGVLSTIDCGGGTGCSTYYDPLDPFHTILYPYNFGAGTNPGAIAIDPTGKFAYVANYGGGISAYSINTTTGALSSVGPDVAAGTIPEYVTVDPTGRFVYVTNYGDNNISAYAINTTTGALTAIDCGGGSGCNGAKFATAGTNPNSIAIDPSGKFAFVTNNGSSSDVSVFTIDATTGALTRKACAAPASCSGFGNFSTALNPISVITTGTRQ